eukprot:14239255-Alexandrium_andersonii.AAC.1
MPGGRWVGRRSSSRRCGWRGRTVCGGRHEPRKGGAAQPAGRPGGTRPGAAGCPSCRPCPARSAGPKRRGP